MHVLRCALLAAAMLAGCQTSQASLPPPVIQCFGPSAADCSRAAQAAEAAVEAAGYGPIHIWITDGLFCPVEQLLFDPLANCPYPIPPEGGQWVGSVDVGLVGTDLHAGVLIAKVANAYTAKVIGYRVPPPGWCWTECPSRSP